MISTREARAGWLTEELTELLLSIASAKSTDGGESLFANILREEEAGNDDSQDDKDQRNCCS